MLVIQNFYNHSLNRNIRHNDSYDKDKSWATKNKIVDLCESDRQSIILC